MNICCEGIETSLQASSKYLESAFTPKKEIFFIDHELIPRLELSKLEGIEHFIFISINRDEDCIASLIEKTVILYRNSIEKIHLVAHGEPGLLRLGKGVTIDEIEEIAIRVDCPESNLYVWGCKVGLNNKGNCGTSSVITSNTNLGQGVTLDESTHFGQIIKKLDFALDWISSGGLLSSAENPVFNDESQLWSHNSVTLEKDFNFQENSFLSGEIFPATIYSSDETFETWNFNINSRSNGLTFSVPSQFLQGENQFRWANIEVDDSGSVSNWSTRIDAEDFNLEKFNKAGNKVIVYYDAINELYSIDGRLNFDNGILINLKTDNENRILVENLTFNESLEIDGWSVSGGTIFERLREIGLMRSIPFASEYDGQQDNISLTEPFTFNNTADGEEAEISRFTLLSGEITVDELELNRIQQGEDSGQGSDELDGSIEDAELTEETSETNWTIGKLDASGDLAVEVAGFDIESNIVLEAKA